MDPYEISGPIPAGVLYLWFECTTIDGLTGAEFGLRGDLKILDLIPRNGFLNAGTIKDPILVTACRAGPVVAAQLLVEEPAVSSGESVRAGSWGQVKSLYR